MMRETEMTDYEAFVYEIKIVKSDGTYRYIGWRYGLINGYYWNSSELQILKEDWRNHPDSREYIIHGTGTRYDMAYLEWKMLTAVDARNNPFYYNATNGGGKYLKKHGKVNMIYQIHDDIKEGKFLSSPIELNELNNLYFYQIREQQIDRSHGALLGQKISDLQGDMSEWEPILILEDMEGPNGEPHTVGQGNHTTFGANQASKDWSITPIPCQRIPKSVWSKLDEDEIESLLLLLNPLDEKPRLSTSEGRAIAWVLKQYRTKNVPIKAQSNLEYLMRMNFTKKKIEQGIMVKAKEQLDNEDNIPDGMIIVDYKSGDDKRNLQGLMASWEKRGYVTMACSTGVFKWDTLLQEKVLKNDKSTKYAIFVYHTSVKTKKNWDEHYGQTIRDTLKVLGEQMGNKNKFYLHDPLKFLKENPLLQPNDLLEE
tara:strand:- start:221 stop:1498 length:1278 start_codon:yes stop_codon:yes gene_type:complete